MLDIQPDISRSFQAFAGGESISVDPVWQYIKRFQPAPVAPYVDIIRCPGEQTIVQVLDSPESTLHDVYDLPFANPVEPDQHDTAMLYLHHTGKLLQAQPAPPHDPLREYRVAAEVFGYTLQLGQGVELKIPGDQESGEAWPFDSRVDLIPGRATALLKYGIFSDDIAPTMHTVSLDVAARLARCGIPTITRNGTIYESEAEALGIT